MRIDTIDLEFQGTPHVIAAFLIHGPKGPVLIETGPESTLPALSRGLAQHGVRVEEIKDVLKFRGFGLLVAGIDSDHPARGAGLEPGDVITRVQDQPVYTIQQFLAVGFMFIAQDKRQFQAFHHGGYGNGPDLRTAYLKGSASYPVLQDLPHQTPLFHVKIPPDLQDEVHM